MDNNMTSLYSKYVQERAGREILEHNDGFATYSIYPDHVYIEDVYIVPHKRNSGICSKMVKQIELKAKQKGAKKTVITVAPTARTANDTLKIVLKMNFKVFSSTSELIFFSREIL